MIRKIIMPDTNILTLNIPAKYIGKKLEVIAFVVDESTDDVLYSARSRKSFSSIKLNTKGFKFNRKEANER